MVFDFGSHFLLPARSLRVSSIMRNKCRLIKWPHAHVNMPTRLDCCLLDHWEDNNRIGRNQVIRSFVYGPSNTIMSLVFVWANNFDVSKYLFYEFLHGLYPLSSNLMNIPKVLRRNRALAPPIGCHLFSPDYAVFDAAESATGGGREAIPLQGNFENPDTLTTFGKEKPDIPHRICKYEVLC